MTAFIIFCRNRNLSSEKILDFLEWFDNNSIKLDDLVSEKEIIEAYTIYKVS